MSRASRADWAERVRRWRGSGRTAKEFAAEAGLNPSTLSYWAWKLEAEARHKRSSTGAGGRRSRADSTGALPFVELRELATVTSSAAALEIVLPGGIVVRVPADFDESTLRRLVSALEAGR